MLAIVIPYYKILFFEETLKSLANQTNQDFKVYICNDASPESPESLLNKYTNKFDFEYFKYDNNLGSISLVKHWERCIKKLQNESWLMILGESSSTKSSIGFAALSI